MKLLFENCSADYDPHRPAYPGDLPLYWNTRQASNPHTVAYERLIMTYNPEHRHLYRDKDWSGVVEETDLFRMIARRGYDHTEAMRIESWKGLARSTSYIRVIGDEKFSDFERDLERIMSSQPGAIDLDYTTDVWLAETNASIHSEDQSGNL